MVRKQQVKTKDMISQLEQFALGFEYDKTLKQVKHDVRIRTLS
jgi:hypothetical protein